MDKTEFFKEAYYFELNRKHELTTSLTIPIGIASFFVGIIFYYLQTFNFKASKGDAYIFGILLLVALIFIIGAIYYLFRSYYGFSYQYLPKPDEFNKFFNAMLEYSDYYQNHLEKNGETTNDPKIFADRELKDELTEAYLLAVIKNTENNNLKSGHLHNANGCLILTFVFLVMSSIPYFYNFFVTPSA